MLFGVFVCGVYLPSSAVCVCGSGSNTEKTQTIPAGTTPSLRNFTSQAEFLTSPPFPFLRDILVLPAAMLFVALTKASLRQSFYAVVQIISEEFF